LKKKIVLIIMLMLTIAINSFGEGNNIVAGTSIFPVTLDPAEPWDDSSTIYIRSIYETLVTLEPSTLRVLPSLAISWKSSDNGLTWIFNLRHGVSFHDGTPFNADAVIFTFDRLRNKKSKYRFYDFPLYDEIFYALKEVKKIDEYTVAFTLSEPFAPFLATLSVDCVSIISPSAVKKHKADFHNHPVGTGPFKLGIWKKEKRIELLKFDDYWGKKPGFSKYITVLSNNFNGLLNSFKEKKIDVLFSFSISKLISLKRLNWVGRSETMSLASTFLVFNFNNTYLKNPLFRKAMNYLWNPKIVKLVYQNYASPLYSVIPYGVPGYRKDNLYPFSVEKAKRMLSKAGIKNNINLRFLLMEGSGLALHIITLYSRNLRKAGIKLKIERVKTGKEYSDKIVKGDFDITYSGWIADYPDTDSMVRPLFSKDMKKNGFPNFSEWKNDKVRKLINEARKTGDIKKRELLYKKINRIINRNALCVPLYQSKLVVIYNKRIGELKVTPFRMMNLLSLGKK